MVTQLSSVHVVTVMKILQGCWLLSSGRADVNIRDFRGDTALVSACRSGHGDIARMLVKDILQDYRTSLCGSS